MRYRRRFPVVEAVEIKIDPETTNRGVFLFHAWGKRIGIPLQVNEKGIFMTIKARNAPGYVGLVHEGDWIVIFEDGNKEVYTGEAFRLKYEPVSSPRRKKSVQADTTNPGP